MGAFVKFICTECGHVFDGDEAFVIDETLDCIDGIPYKETYTVCPECNGQYEQAVQCEKCGEWFRWDDLIAGVMCESCVMEELNDADKVRRYAAENLDDFAEFCHAEGAGENADV